MSNQEVWITLRIKSELPVEEDAPTFAEALARRINQCMALKPKQYKFFYLAEEVEVMGVDQEADIYGLE